MRISEWEDYIARNYTVKFYPGALVLDVGCGYGNQIKALSDQGCSVIGIDLDIVALLHCRKQGLFVLRAYAEQVCIKTASIDGILCKVVLPYTHERLVICEFGRLLKPGGKCYLQCHGAGYYLNYLLLSRSWKRRFYGLRALINTWIWTMTGRLMPGFLGDTTYQSRQRLAKYFHQNGLHLLQDIPSKSFLGFPVFIYQELVLKSVATCAA